MRSTYATFLLAVAVLTLLAASCGGGARVQTRTVPGEPGLEYAVDGDYLYLVCVGHGSPVVVLEAGLGGDHRAWSDVQPELARTTRVCSYDRAGLGLSQLAPRRATATAKADELRDLLAAARVEPPYVLVGHSYGGLLVRVFAGAHADEVAGVVLVDASHPDQRRAFLQTLRARRVGENAAVRELRREIVRVTPNPEGVDWRASSDEARAAGTLGSRPLVVVSAGHEDWPPGLPDLATRRLERTWLRLQSDLARLSTDAVHVIAVNSSHAVMATWGQPSVVIRAIRAVVHAARSQAQLPPCSALFEAGGVRCL
jgi:pimeloyl-ACP methyl ester carboxylesterase